MDRYSVYEKFKKTLFSKIQNRNKLLKYKEYFRFNKDIELLSVYRNARKWIYTNTVPGKGIRPSVGLDDTKTDIAYPEVSGYYIPSLLHYGFRDLAKQYAKWLLSIQHEEGAWYDYLDKAPYVFDTGQILKGLIAIYPMVQNRDSCQIRILEIYADQEAYKKHIASEHFQIYKQGTLHMVKSLDLVDMTPMNPDGMKEIFSKMK